MRTSEIEGRPVVTYQGEDIAQVKDVVFAAAGGRVGGFTLAGRGLFAGPKKEALAWESVAALGAEAVMVESEAALEPRDAVLEKSARSGGFGGDVLGSRVLTDSGTELGTVVDVVVQVADDSSTCEVVGYEIAAAEELESKGKRLLIPLPSTISASQEYLVVPDGARDFVGNDLAGFGAAVEAFRRRLEGGA